MTGWAVRPVTSNGTSSTPAVNAAKVLSPAQEAELIAYRDSLNPAAIGREIADLQTILLKLAKDKTEQLYLASFPSLLPRVRLLVVGTISYNVVEAIVAITAGRLASSTALIGFGLDSVIEVASAGAVAWQFSGSDPEDRERITLCVIASSFFALAGYVTVESVRSLFGATEAEHSTVGIVLAVGCTKDLGQGLSFERI